MLPNELERLDAEDAAKSSEAAANSAFEDADKMFAIADNSKTGVEFEESVEVDKNRMKTAADLAFEEADAMFKEADKGEDSDGKGEDSADSED